MNRLVEQLLDQAKTFPAFCSPVCINAAIEITRLREFLHSIKDSESCPDLVRRINEVLNEKP